MYEPPDRAIIDTYAAICKFGYKASEGKVGLGPLQQPVTMSPRKRRGLVTPDALGRDAAGRIAALEPMHCRTGGYAETRCRFMSGQAFVIDRRNHALTQIHRIRSDHGSISNEP